MNNKAIGKMVMLVFGIAALAMAVSAATTLNANAGGIGANDTSSGGAASADTIVAYGGNITNFDLYTPVQTLYWVGYFGEVNKSTQLAGASATFYTWTETTDSTTGVVLFVNDTGVNWGAGITGGLAADREAEDTTLGLTGEPDAVNETFTLTNTNGFTLDANPAIDPTDAVSVNTSSNGGDEWETCLLTQAGLTIYAGIMNADNENYAGDAADFQVMVPVDGTTKTRTYYLYTSLD